MLYKRELILYAVSFTQPCEFKTMKSGGIDEMNASEKGTDPTFTTTAKRRVSVSFLSQVAVHCILRHWSSLLFNGLVIYDYCLRNLCHDCAKRRATTVAN